MSDPGESFVAEHPYLALLGAAAIATVVDVAISLSFGGGIDPASTALFVAVFTLLYGGLLYRSGHLGPSG